jgi:glycosyltransferase involved in cell wall biosynthesis
VNLPRLLLTTFESVPGPSEASRRALAWLAAAEGRFETVVLSLKTPERSHVERLHGARVLRVPVGSGDLASRHEAFERAVRRQVASDGFELAHFMDPFSGRALCDTRAAHGAALLYDPASLPSRELAVADPAWAANRRGRLRIRRWEIACAVRADAVAAATTSLADHVLSLGVDPDRVHLVPQPATPLPEAAAADGGHVRLLFPGTLLPHDGLDTALSALGLLGPGAEVSVCVCAPTPAPEPALRARAQALGAPDRVTASAGFPSPAPGTVDVAVFPLAPAEHNLGAGGLVPSLADALARGLPVLAADLPLLRGMLPESAALFHRPGDARALAGHVTRILREPALRARLARGARAVAAAQHAPQVASQRLLALYARLLSRT